jgi:hypothetical protein
MSVADIIKLQNFLSSSGEELTRQQTMLDQLKMTRFIVEDKNERKLWKHRWWSLL